MPDARVDKMIGKGVPEQVAEALVKAGFDTPRKIKAASDKDLEAIKGIGPATVAGLRDSLPKPTVAKGPR